MPSAVCATCSGVTTVSPTAFETTTVAADGTPLPCAVYTVQLAPACDSVSVTPSAAIWVSDMPSLMVPKPSEPSSGPLSTDGSFDGGWGDDGCEAFDVGEAGGAEPSMSWVLVGTGAEVWGCRPAVRFSGGLTLIEDPSADITAVPSSACRCTIVSPPETATTAAATPVTARTP